MYKYGGGVNRRAQVEAEFMFQQCQTRQYLLKMQV